MVEDAAKQAVIHTFRVIATEYHSLCQQIEDLNHRKSYLEAKAQDCHAAARLFGFDVVAAAASIDAQNTTHGPPQIPPSNTIPPKIAKSNEDTGGINIRQFVLDEAQRAFPDPVRAKNLRESLKAKGRDVHDKTMGMTLYRLSKEGEMRRDGWDWYYVKNKQEELNVDPLS
jgi:uncharacterized protein (UPF0335 family)